MKALSVIGIGKLGLSMAACFASKGYPVIGVDVNPETIRAVNQGKSPLYEPGLEEMVRNSQGRLVATGDYSYAIKNSGVTFIVVPTPSEEEGNFSTRYVEEAAQNIARELQSKKAFHIVALTSTVLPGVTESLVRPLLERVSGKKCGKDFGLCYNPEFIALGSVLRDFLNPDMILIGESDPRSGELLAEIYANVCDNHPPLARMTPWNAELTKIALNSFVTMKISFANILAELCERMPGGNVDAVTRALGLDSRIGGKYLQGGLSYGGPCFPRDNKALSYFARQVGCHAKLAETTNEVNEDQVRRIVGLIKQEVGELKGKKVALLGLTYKPNTDVVEESASLKIALALLQEGAEVKVYDPAGSKNGERMLGKGGIYFASSAQECLRDTELCLVATLWEEFKSLRAEDFVQNMRKPVLLDCWRIYDCAEFSQKLHYLAIGLDLSLQLSSPEDDLAIRIGEKH